MNAQVAHHYDEPKVRQSLPMCEYRAEHLLTEILNHVSKPVVPVSPIKEGGLREAADKCSHLLESAFPDDLGYISKLNPKAKRHIATIIANAFAGFVPLQVAERRVADASAWAEGFRQDGLAIIAQRDAAQAQNVHLLADNAALLLALAKVHTRDHGDYCTLNAKDECNLTLIESEWLKTHQAVREIVTRSIDSSPKSPTG